MTDIQANSFEAAGSPASELDSCQSHNRLPNANGLVGTLGKISKSRNNSVLATGFQKFKSY